MSEEMVSYTDTVDIYVPLLNEGTDVVRPTKAIPLGRMRYKVLPTSDYSPDLEEWEFPPGSIVECRIENREGKQVLVARHKVAE
jgi:hypothetical protein